MTNSPHALFFTRTGLSEERARAITADALRGTDDGELFLEYAQSESLVFDDGKLKNASYNTSQGFGLRSVLGEAVGSIPPKPVVRTREQAQVWLPPTVAMPAAELPPSAPSVTEVFGGTAALTLVAIVKSRSGVFSSEAPPS